MRGKTEEKDHRRHVDDSAPDAQDARHKPDDKAEPDPIAPVERVDVLVAVSIDESPGYVPSRERGLRVIGVRHHFLRYWLEEREKGYTYQYHAEYHAEDGRGEVAGQISADKSPGHRGGGELDPRPIVDALLAHVGYRAGGGVGEDDGEGSADSVLGIVVEDQEENRYHNKASTGSDHGTVDRDEEPEEKKDGDFSD